MGGGVDSGMGFTDDPVAPRDLATFYARRHAFPSHDAAPSVQPWT